MRGTPHSDHLSFFEIGGEGIRMLMISSNFKRANTKPLDTTELTTAAKLMGVVKCDERDEYIAIMMPEVVENKLKSLTKAIKVRIKGK